MNVVSNDCGTTALFKKMNENLLLFQMKVFPMDICLFIFYKTNIKRDGKFFVVNLEDC